MARQKRKAGLFRTNLLLSYLIIILLPSILAAVMFTVKSKQEEQVRLLNLMDQLNSQLMRSYSFAMEDTKKNESVFLIDHKIIDTMSREEYESESDYYVDLLYIKKAIRQAVSTSSYLAGVTFVGESGRVYDNTGEDKAYMNGLYATMETTDRNWQTSKVYKAKLNRKEMNVVTISKRLNNPYYNSDAGFIHLSVNFDKVFNAFETKDDILKTNSFFILQNGEVVYNSGSTDFTSIQLDIEQRLLEFKQTGKQFFTMSGYLFMPTYSEENQFYIVQYLSDSYIWQGMSQSLVMYFILLLGVSVCAVIVSCMLSNYLSRPVTLLADAMKQIETEHFPQLPIQGNGEMGELVEGFNHMSRRLEDSIINEYQSRIAQKNLQMKLLQSRINPHFIYNTLNLLSSMAQLNNMSTIADISATMAHMLYYNLHGSDYITLQEELEQVKRYMQIQKWRFPNKVTDIYDIQPEAHGCMMIKFLLQPLIENSMYHGIEKKVGSGRVCISATVWENKLILLLTDDGVGIPEVNLSKIRAHLEQDQLDYLLNDNGEYMGVINVYNRLQNAYGDNCSFKIESEDGIGTKVEIIIPFSDGTATVAKEE